MQGNTKPAVLDALRTSISEASTLYLSLIAALRSRAEATATSGAGDAASADAQKPYLDSISRSFVFLGDLARYSETLVQFQPGTEGMDAAASDAAKSAAAQQAVAQAGAYYQVAVQLNPTSGNPHNQLAVLCLNAKDNLAAVYRYARSLLAETPFPTARENLMQVLERNRQSVAQLADSPQVKQLRSWGSKSLTLPPPPAEGPTPEYMSQVRTVQHNHAVLRGWSQLTWVRITGALWTLANTEQVPRLVRDGVEDVSRLLRHGALPSPPSAVLLPTAALALFTAHTARAQGAEALSVGGATANPQRRAVAARYAELAVLSLFGALARVASKPLPAAQKALRSYARVSKGGSKGSDEALQAAGLALTDVQRQTYPLLDVLGVLADWLAAHPSVVVGTAAATPVTKVDKKGPGGAKDKKGPGAGRSAKGGKGGRAAADSKAAPAAPADVHSLLTVARRGLLTGLAQLCNKLLVLARPLLNGSTHEHAALATLAALAGNAPPSVASTGMATLPLPEDMPEAQRTPPPAEGATWVDVALPEESDWRGFLAMGGAYDALLLPGTAQGQVFLGGLERFIPQLARQAAAQDGTAAAVPPTPHGVDVAKRIGKLARLLGVLADTPGCALKRQESNGKFLVADGRTGDVPAAAAAGQGSNKKQRIAGEGTQGTAAPSAVAPVDAEAAAQEQDAAAVPVAAPATAALVAAAVAQRKGKGASAGKGRKRGGARAARGAGKDKGGKRASSKASPAGSSGEQDAPSGGAADGGVMRFGPDGGRATDATPAAAEQQALLSAGASTSNAPAAGDGDGDGDDESSVGDVVAGQAPVADSPEAPHAASAPTEATSPAPAPEAGLAQPEVSLPDSGSAPDKSRRGGKPRAKKSSASGGNKAGGRKGSRKSGPKPASGRTSARNVAGRSLVDVHGGERKTSASRGPRHVSRIAGGGRRGGAGMGPGPAGFAPVMPRTILQAGEHMGMVGVGTAVLPPSIANGGGADGDDFVEGETIVQGPGAGVGSAAMFNMAPYAAMPPPMPGYGMGGMGGGPMMQMHPHMGMQGGMPMQYSGFGGMMMGGAGPNMFMQQQMMGGGMQGEQGGAGTPPGSMAPSHSAMSEQALGYSNSGGMQGMLSSAFGGSSAAPGASSGAQSAPTAADATNASAGQDGFGEALGGYSANGVGSNSIWGQGHSMGSAGHDTSEHAGSSQGGDGAFGAGALGLGLLSGGELGALSMGELPSGGNNSLSAES